MYTQTTSINLVLSPCITLHNPKKNIFFTGIWLLLLLFLLLLLLLVYLIFPLLADQLSSSFPVFMSESCQVIVIFFPSQHVSDPALSPLLYIYTNLLRRFLIFSISLSVITLPHQVFYNSSQTTVYRRTSSFLLSDLFTSHHVSRPYKNTGYY